MSRRVYMFPDMKHLVAHKIHIKHMGGSFLQLSKGTGWVLNLMSFPLIIICEFMTERAWLPILGADKFHPSFKCFKFFGSVLLFSKSDSSQIWAGLWIWPPIPTPAFSAVFFWDTEEQYITDIFLQVLIVDGAGLSWGLVKTLLSYTQPPSVPSSVALILQAMGV